MKRLGTWIFVAALAFGAACFGQSGPLVGLAQADSQVTISGTLRDLSGAPAAGVFVTFYPGHYFTAPHAAEISTDKNGRYEMLLHLHNPASEGFEGVVIPTNCLMARDLKRNLAAIQEFSGIPTKVNFTLQPGITLMGSVKNTKGAPLINALVDLRFYAGGWERRVVPRLLKVEAQGALSIPDWLPLSLGDLGDKVTLDEQGSFSIPALPQGLGLDAVTVDLAPGETRTIDFTRTNGSSISGGVTGAGELGLR